MIEQGKNLRDILELEDRLSRQTEDAQKKAQLRIEEAKQQAQEFMQDVQEQIRELERSYADAFAKEEKKIMDEHEQRILAAIEKMKQLDAANRDRLLRAALDRVLPYER